VINLVDATVLHPKGKFPIGQVLVLKTSMEVLEVVKVEGDDVRATSIAIFGEFAGTVKR
jgi:hypothetical protein